MRIVDACAEADPELRTRRKLDFNGIRLDIATIEVIIKKREEIVRVCE